MPSTKTDWNPRFLEYCRVHNEPNPEKVSERYEGYLFSLWIQKKWREWYAQLPACDWFSGPYACRIAGHIRELHQDHKAFDNWLKEQTT